MSKDRIIGLDVVRAIAITMVVAFHGSPILYPLTHLPHIGKPLHLLFALQEPFGMLGVELFFVLSGFLIGTILIKVFLKTDDFTGRSIFQFLTRRWFRTLPNYWLILVINFIVYQFVHLNHFSWGQLRYFVFVQNLWYPHPPFFPEAWSLAVEEWFYLTLPAALYLFHRLTGRASKQRTLFVVFLAYAVVFLLLRCTVNNNVADPLYFDKYVRKVVVLRLDAIAYGFLIAYLNIFRKEQLMKWRKTLLAGGISSALVLTLVHYMAIHPGIAFYNSSQVCRVFINVFLPTLLSLSFAMVLPYAASTRSIRSKWFTAVVTRISMISYSMYLLHFTLIFWPFAQYHTFTVYNSLPLYIAYWTLVIVASSLLYRYFEVPVMNLRSRFSQAEPSVQ